MGWWQSEKELALAFVGKRITAIEVDGDQQHYLRFTTASGTVCIEAEGDCCSESWFYHVLGVDALIGHTVMDVRSVEMPDAPEDGKGRQDSDQLYGFRFTTTGGRADVEFRNSSNGYYGGWLNVVTAVPEEVRMVPITADYTA
jgi:hypothetical protein